jgi:hypothetical protein
MRRLLLLLALGAFAPGAKADWFHTLVGYKCNPKTDRLIIYFVGAYNEKGEEMVAKKSSNEWAPWSLISMRDDDHIGELKTVERVCDLPHAKYRLYIGPSPGNANVQGRCGAHMSAWIQVFRNDILVLPTRSFEGDCHSDDDVLTRVTFAKGREAPQMRFSSKNSFWETGGLDP